MTRTALDALDALDVIALAAQTVAAAWFLVATLPHAWLRWVAAYHCATTALAWGFGPRRFTGGAS